MSKIVTRFYCQSCGANYAKWSGQCEACKEWNTIVEEKFTKTALKNKSDHSIVTAQKINDIEESEFANRRFLSHINELDRVTGGGFVPGSVVLIGGDPGIGKSTLLLQTIAQLAKNYVCAYVSGEEAPLQIKMRSNRLNISGHDYWLICETQLNGIIDSLKKIKDLAVVIIDSIQTMALYDVESSAGSVSQVRGCSQVLIEFAKKNNIVVVLVGHVTKDGALAGPRVLEHMVDTVLYFEGERNYDYRILRSIKNRFGAANEIGIFEMSEQGLKEVHNPSALFLPTHHEHLSGTAIFAGIEGNRPILCEVQALVVPSGLASPRRNVIGWDHNRLSMILAVLEKQADIRLGTYDVFLNISGGLKTQDPGCDLAAAAALISAFKNEPYPQMSAFFGEIGLSGEVRNVAHAQQRIQEAEKLGFQRIYTTSHIKKQKTNMDVIKVNKLHEMT